MTHPPGRPARQPPTRKHPTARRLAGDPQAPLALGLVTISIVVLALGHAGDGARLIAISAEFLAA